MNPVQENDTSPSEQRSTPSAMMPMFTSLLLLGSVKAAHQAIVIVMTGTRHLSIEMKETDNVKKAVEAVRSVPLSDNMQRWYDV